MINVSDTETSCTNKIDTLNLVDFIAWLTYLLIFKSLFIEFSPKIRAKSSSTNSRFAQHLIPHLNLRGLDTYHSQCACVTWGAKSVPFVNLCWNFANMAGRCPFSQPWVNSSRAGGVHSQNDIFTTINHGSKTGHLAYPIHDPRNHEFLQRNLLTIPFYQSMENCENHSYI